MKKVLNTATLTALNRQARLAKRKHLSSLEAVDPEGFHLIDRSMIVDESEYARCELSVKIIDRDEPSYALLDISLAALNAMPSYEQVMDELVTLNPELAMTDEELAAAV